MSTNFWDIRSSPQNIKPIKKIELAEYGKFSKNLYNKILILTNKIPKFGEGSNQFCLPLQNLLLPFASMVRIENKFRFCFGVRNFRTFTVIGILRLSSSKVFK